MEENKNESTCCGSKCQCAALKNKWVKIILVIISVVIIFSIGVCCGRHKNRFEGRNDWSEGAKDCPMMHGDRFDQTGCPRMNTTTGTTTEIK